jgi:hypothetical protein
MTYSMIISTEDVYGNSNPKIPSGYVKTGEFRPPRTGDFFLNSTETSAMRASHNHSTGNPRIILRKLDEKELFIQQALSFLKSLPLNGGRYSQDHWDLILKAEELLDV